MEENLLPAHQVVVGNESNRALVATKALEIVLQHWLIPDLGWSTTAQNGAALLENMAGQTILPDGDIDPVSVFISFVQLFIGTYRELTHGQSLLTLHTKHNLNIVKLYGINVLDLPNTMPFIQC